MTPTYLLPIIGTTSDDESLPTPDEGFVIPYIRADGKFCVKLATGETAVAGEAAGPAAGAGLPNGSRGAIVVLDGIGGAISVSLGVVGQVFGIPEPELGTQPQPGWVDAPSPGGGGLPEAAPGAVLVVNADGQWSALPPGTANQVLGVTQQGEGAPFLPVWVDLPAATGGGSGGSGSGGQGQPQRLDGAIGGSTAFSDDYSASKAVDGDPSTAFVTQVDGDQYLALSRQNGAPVVLTQVRVLCWDQEPGQVGGSVVQGSWDREAWVTVAAAPDNTEAGGWVEIPVVAAPAYRHFRLRGLPGNGLAVAEIEFYGR